MPTIRSKENEPAEMALRRFKRACEKAGILNDIKKRQHHVKRSEKRKHASDAAVKRNLKRINRDKPQSSRTKH